ncbi:WD40 repeat-like protein [Pholiota conissans]|uniref:WD40 repeat-like protein n=1 Tax=Pholiota conissans TaxID=109636 RepID=A0A9P5ZED1_9AGAR|nr:WD40 repeat-like protein [Pholiota conissans]
MDNHTHEPPRAAASVNTLASALGISGTLRLLPQGSAPKPHIVLKRDYLEDKSADGSTAGTVRLSFIAGKRFTISKGQPLLFAIASPDDPDGKALLGDVNSFLLEASIVDVLSEGTEGQARRSGTEAPKMSERPNIGSLPPRMRKSVGPKLATAGGSDISSSALDAARAHRPLCSTAVQTEPTEVEKPTDVSSPRRTPLSIPHHLEHSPTQLPSPVSADHAREVIPDRLVPYEDAGDDGDYAHSDRSRSLSPMDLSSENNSPANSLMTLPASLAKGSKGDLPPESLLMQSPPLDTSQPMDVSEEASAAPPSPSAMSSTAAPSLPQVLTPAPSISELSSLSADSDSETSEPSEELEASLTNAVDEPQQVEPEEKELPKAAESAPALENVAPAHKSPSPAPVAPTQEAVNTPSASCAETQTPRVVPRVSEARVEDTPLQQPQKPSATRPAPVKSASSKSLSSAAPAFVKSVASSIQGTWDATPSAPYIPTPTVGNPLGIRPSSSLPLISKPIPTGPRSLTGLVPKKPVVVGARWSAARNSGPSTVGTSNSSISASSSSLSLSSTLTSLPSSPSIPPEPAPFVPKTDLSSILRYTSPSPPPSPPPPLPDSEPPSSPPPTQQPVNKWKRVVGSDKPLPKVHLIGPAPERAVVPEANPLKRPHESAESVSTGSSSQLTDTSDEDRPSKRSKTNSPAPPSPKPSPLVIRVKPLTHKTLPATLSTSILSPESASSTSSSDKDSTSKYAKPQLPPQPAPAFAKVMIPIPKGTVTLKHPLPPKPVIPVTGSSYRPSASRDPKADANRERDRRWERDDEREKERDPVPPPPPTSTDWPPTSPNKEFRLYGTLSAEPSVQKIALNGDGTLVAVVCSDRTLRILETRSSPVTEQVRLGHSAPIASACWLEGFSAPAVLTMCMDGSVAICMRGPNRDWKSSPLLTVPLPETRSQDTGAFCMAYSKGRIAVSVSSVVKVWLHINGTWQPQREIVRSGVTALKFVQDGNALIGGCRDGVLWYCEVPNGTLRMHAFLQAKPIVSIDVHPTGTYLLVAQEGGFAHLVTMRPNENKGVIERTYTSEKIQSMAQKGFTSAVFATKGQAVVYGTINGCALVWDRKKGSIVYGLKHPEGDPVQVAATFDGRPGFDGFMMTGTKQGRLFWWPVPQAKSSTGTPNASERKRQKVA